MSELEPQPGDAWHPYMIPDEKGVHIPYRYRGEQHQRFDTVEIPAAPTPIGVWEISTKDIAAFHNEHDECTAQVMIDSATVTPRLFISGWKDIDPPAQYER